MLVDLQPSLFECAHSSILDCSGQQDVTPFGRMDFKLIFNLRVTETLRKAVQ